MKAWNHPALYQQFRLAVAGSLWAPSYQLSIAVDHVHLDASSHVTKLKSSPNGFLNMTMSPLYSNGLHSWIQKEIHSLGTQEDSKAIIS